MICKLVLFALLAVSTQALVSDIGSLIKEEEGGNRKLQGVLDNFSDKIKSIAKSVGANFDREFRRLSDELEDIKEKGTAAGIDISQCIKDEGKFQDVPANFTKQLSKCVTDKLQEAQNIYDNSMQAITDTMKDVRKAEAELKECSKKGPVAGPICYTKVAAKIAALTTNVPSKIATEVAMGAKLIGNLIPSMTSCANEALFQTIPTASQIQQNMVTCINSKIAEV